MQYDPEALATALPDLRRFARALCGSQATGDAYAAATLESILAEEESAQITQSGDARRYLFTVFCAIWRSTGARASERVRASGLHDQEIRDGLTTTYRKQTAPLASRHCDNSCSNDVVVSPKFCPGGPS